MKFFNVLCFCGVVFFYEMHSAAVMQVAQFGLDAIGNILGKMAAAKEEVINKTEGYKAEAINAIREVTNVVNRASVQMQNLVSISRSKGELIRQQGLYQKNLELVVNPLFEVIYDVYKQYVEEVKKFIYQYNSSLKNNNDTKVLLLLKLIVMSIQNTFNDYVFLLKKYNYELHSIGLKIQSNNADGSMYANVSEVKKKSNKNINLVEAISEIDKLMMESDKIVDLLMKEKSMIQSNNSIAFNKITAQMLDSFNSMEDRERIKDITDNNQKIYNIFDVIDDVKSKMDNTFDNIHDLYSNSLIYLYKIHILLSFNYNKISKMISLVNKMESNKKYDLVSFKNDIMKDFEKSISSLNKERDTFLALQKNQSDIFGVFKKIKDFLSFFQENVKKINYDKVSLLFSKVKALLNNYYNLFLLKNTQFKNTFTQIGYVDNFMSEDIKKILKLKDKLSTLKEDKSTADSSLSENTLLEEASSMDVTKEHDVFTDKKGIKNTKRRFLQNNMHKEKLVSNASPKDQGRPSQSYQTDQRLHNKVVPSHEVVTHHDVGHKNSQQQKHASPVVKNTQKKIIHGGKKK